MRYELRRSVWSGWDTQHTLDYLVNFENAVEWDSGTKSCERTSGTGGPGTTYRNVSTFAGREVTLTYTTKLVDRERGIFRIIGDSGSTTSDDTITVREVDGRVRIDYLAVFEFPWWGWIARPVLGRMLQRLGDETQADLARAVDGEAATPA